jgi:hypothetical protein
MLLSSPRAVRFNASSGLQIEIGKMVADILAGK